MAEKDSTLCAVILCANVLPLAVFFPIFGNPGSPVKQFAG